MNKVVSRIDAKYYYLNGRLKERIPEKPKEESEIPTVIRVKASDPDYFERKLFTEHLCNPFGYKKRTYNNEEIRDKLENR